MTDTVVAQAVVLRCYPNEDQAGKLRQWIGAARALWNHLLAVQKATYAAEKKFLSQKEMDVERQRWEQEPDCAWRQAAQSNVRQRIVIELDRALRDFRKSRTGKRAGARLGFPRFKRKMPGGTCYIANTRLKVDAEARRVELGKLGAMRVRGGRMPGGRILGARMRHSAGHWFLAVQFEAAAPRTYGKPSLDALGVDVGLKSTVARSDGVVTAAPRFFRKAEKKLARLQRRLSASVELAKRTRTRLSGRGWRKAQKVARLHERIGDCRRDFLHTRSSRIVGKGATIGIETLAIKAMARGRLGKSVGDAGMAELHRQIVYKAAWSGRQVVRAGRFDRSTGVCPDCGTVGPKLPLNIRSWSCAECGARHDRDIAAARVLEGHARQQVGRGTPEGTRVETGGQAAAAGPLHQVPVVEARSGEAAAPGEESSREQSRSHQVGAVSAEPAVKQPPTRVESGVQAATASPSPPVPLVEARSAKQRIRGRGSDILLHVGEPASRDRPRRLRGGTRASPSGLPLFEWRQGDGG